MVRALYGDPESGKQWYNMLVRILETLSFEKSELDPCLFYFSDNGGDVYLVIYVDDIGIFATNISYRDKFTSDISKLLPIGSQDMMEKFIGIEVDDLEGGGVFAHHKTYTEIAHRKFGYGKPRAWKTPSLVTHESHIPFKEVVALQNLPTRVLSEIGSARYPANLTRKDLLFALQKSMGDASGGLIERAMEYWFTTKNLGITILPKQQEIELFAYSDARLGASPGLASVFYLTKWSGAFHADCHVAHRAVTSIVEMEYYALVECAKTCLFFRNLLAEMGFPQSKPTVIYCDCMSAVHLAHTEAYRELSRHFDPCLHIIREWRKRGLITVRKIGTADNVADILTKAMQSAQYERLRGMLLAGPGDSGI
jgi:hypothetical protein